MQAARDANACKVPMYQADLTNIQNTFMAAVKEVKKEFGSDVEAQKAISKEITADMFAALTKGQDMRNPSIVPQQFADAVTGTVSNMHGIDQDALSELNKALVGFAEAVKAQNEKPVE